MNEMEEITVKGLLVLHNERCAPGAKLADWKRPKADLIDRIRVLGDAEPEQREPEATEKPEADDARPGDAAAATVSALVRELLGLDYTYDAIVAAVQAAFPDAKTTTRSVASMASRLRRAGVDVASRRAGASGGN